MLVLLDHRDPPRGLLVELAPLEDRAEEALLVGMFALRAGDVDCPRHELAVPLSPERALDPVGDQWEPRHAPHPLALLGARWLGRMTSLPQHLGVLGARG